MPRLLSRRSSAPLLRLAIALMLVPLIAGCRGCGSSTPATKQAKDAAAKKAEEEAKRKSPFEVGPVTPLLSESMPAPDAKGSLRLAKPGHWTATVQTITANDDNFEGRTTIAAVTRDGQPIAIPDTDFAMTSARPALLAKGRAKRVTNEILPPTRSGRLRVVSSLTSGGAPVAPRQLDLWTLMPANQYFLVVLAREPARYSYLKVSDAIRAPYEDTAGDTTPPHYRVVLADGDKTVPLPASALTWTGVAYVVWDQVNLAQVTPEQQQALVDWLHWGGRLVINGPDSLATLRGTFLDKHLPVDIGKTITIDDGELADLSAYWGERRESTKPLSQLKATRPWSGVELTPRAGKGVALPGAEGLFYEGPVGAGSIVVSAVQLTERDLVSWPGFDGFLNGALLRRPGRRFRDQLADGQVLGLQTIWADGAFEGRERDAHFTTPLRWFARDAATTANTRIETTTPVVQPGGIFYGSTPVPEETLVVDRPSGLGGWNEFGPVSEAARSALRTAAGIRVPAATFVVVCLALYLIILVPLNWMVFHALGRIEWAWIAAPMIAIAGTIGVVRQAQLDIGFVRSQTEIALLELQGDHPRGDLNRYFALYSSLSTTYDAEFEDDSAVATPFPAEHMIAATGLFEGRGNVEFEKYDHPRLRGVPVTSASTQLVHSEQITELAGPLRLTSPPSNPHALTLENKTGLDLADATVVHRLIRNGKVQYESCWLGEVRNGMSQILAWEAAYPKKDELLYAPKRAEAAKLALGQRLDVDELLKLSFTFPAPNDPLYGARDEYRLVARVDATIPGASTNPAASQTTGATVVLAHLRTSLPPAPTPDANSRADITAKPQRDFDEEGN